MMTYRLRDKGILSIFLERKNNKKTGRIWRISLDSEHLVYKIYLLFSYLMYKQISIFWILAKINKKNEQTAKQFVHRYFIELDFLFEIVK